MVTITAYHGTSADFETFRAMPSNHGNPAPFDCGLWFSTDEAEAASYQQGTPRDRLITVEIDATNAHTLESDDEAEALAAAEQGAKVLLNAEGADNIFVLDPSVITIIETEWTGIDS